MNDLCSTEMYHKFWERVQYSPNYLSTYQDQYKQGTTFIINKDLGDGAFEIIVLHNLDRWCLSWCELVYYAKIIETDKKCP